MSAYELAIDAGKLPFERGIKLNSDDKIRQNVIMELMSNFKINIPRIEKELGIDFKTYFKDAINELQPFADDGLLSITDTSIEANETGAMLIRNIAMPFDAYMGKHAQSKKTFSKTV